MPPGVVNNCSSRTVNPDGLGACQTGVVGCENPISGSGGDYDCYSAEYQTPCGYDPGDGGYGDVTSPVFMGIAGSGRRYRITIGWSLRH